MPTAIDSDALLARCEAAQKTLTPQRLSVLKALPSDGQPISAYALKDLLESQSMRYNISTIYRVLDFWVALGVVHKVNSASTYVLCQDHHTHHLHVLQTCTECQQVVEACEVSQAFQLPEQAAFEPSPQQVIELTGLCKDCQAD